MFRPFASIFFLTLLLYNAFGYYALLAYEMNRSRQLQFMEMPESAFMVIKVPVALYTHAENTELEYIEGMIMHQNKTYNMVKKQIKNDTLHIYTLRNQRHEQMSSQFTNYVKEHIAMEKSSSQKHPTKQLIQSFIKDYIPENIYILVVSSFKIADSRHRVAVASCDELPSAHCANISPPPELA